MKPNRAPSQLQVRAGASLPRPLSAAILALLALIFTAGLAAEVLAGNGRNVLILVNEDSVDSKAIARYYAEKRQVPDRNLCRLRTTSRERISREAFEEDILRPAAACLTERHLQDDILYIVTTLGLPLIVDGDAGPVGDLASVDSELTLLYRYLVEGTLPSFGRIDNPFFSASGAADLREFKRADFDIYLVTRLTGPSLVDAIFLVDRAQKPKNGGGFFFDMPSQRASTQSEWLLQAAEVLRKKGFPVQVDRQGEAMKDLSSVLGFTGRRAAGAVGAPTQDWVAGALALALEPDSASSFRKAPESSAAGEGGVASSWISSGLTGFGGFVADPTTDGYFRPQILFPSYVSGVNLAESFYRATRYLGWRQVVVGDPLASPFSTERASDGSIGGGCGLDDALQLPKCFAARREDHLVNKYSTAREPVRHLLRAEALAASGETAQALEALERSLGGDPLLLESNRLMSEILEKEGRIEEALGCLEKMARLEPPAKATYLRIARLAFHELDNPQKAAPYANWLYGKFGANDSSIARLQAEVASASGDSEKALAVYHRAVKSVDPPPAYALGGLGRAYFEQSRWDVAEEFLNAALESAVQSGGSDSEDAQGWRTLLGELPNRETEADAVPEASATTAVSNRSAVRPARVLQKTSTSYPAQAKREGVQGSVVLKLLLDERGQLLKSTVVYGHRLLSKAARKAVENWIFEPRLVNGKPEPSHLTVAIRFKLQKNE